MINRRQFQQASEFIRGIKARKLESEIIVITEDCDAGEIFELLKLGASDFVSKPFDDSDLAALWAYVRSGG